MELKLNLPCEETNQAARLAIGEPGRGLAGAKGRHAFVGCGETGKLSAFFALFFPAQLAMQSRPDFLWRCRPQVNIFLGNRCSNFEHLKPRRLATWTTVMRASVTLVRRALVRSLGEVEPLVAPGSGDTSL